MWYHLRNRRLINREDRVIISKRNPMTANSARTTLHQWMNQEIIMSNAIAIEMVWQRSIHRIRTRVRRSPWERWSKGQYQFVARYDMKPLPTSSRGFGICIRNYILREGTSTTESRWTATEEGDCEVRHPLLQPCLRRCSPLPLLLLRRTQKRLFWSWRWE